MLSAPLPLASNGPLVAVAAHGLIGLSLVCDKVLLKNPRTRNPFAYVFWLGAMSVFGVALVPFGYAGAPRAVEALAFAAGIVNLAGVFFYYVALGRGEASATLPVMGGFSPVATALIAAMLLAGPMSGAQLVGFFLMTAGGFAMFFSERLRLRLVLPPVLLASALLGLVNVLQKLVFDGTNFVTGYVWFTLGTFAGALLLLVPPVWRRQILKTSRDAKPGSRTVYFVNRVAAGFGSFLVFYAISLTHPALVDAISGVRYVVIFLGALLLTAVRPRWLTENFRGPELVTKSIATAVVIAGLAIVAIASGDGGGAARLEPRSVWQRVAAGADFESTPACPVVPAAPAWLRSRCSQPRSSRRRHAPPLSMPPRS